MRNLLERFNAWCDRHQTLVFVLTMGCAILLALIALSGCFSAGSVRPPTEPIPGAETGLGTELESIGGWFTRLGLLVAGLALVACFLPILLPFRPILVVVGEAAGGIALVGGLFVWLSDHVWLVVLACVLTGLAWAYLRRRSLRRWLDRITSEKDVTP